MNHNIGIAAASALIASLSQLERVPSKGPPITYRRVRKHSAKRNDPCPCGSGKKFKKCCINEVVLVEEQLA